MKTISSAAFALWQAEQASSGWAAALGLSSKPKYAQLSGLSANRFVSLTVAAMPRNSPWKYPFPLADFRCANAY